MILAHLGQYSDTPDPEVVERMSQLKAVLDLQKGMGDIKDVKDLFSKLNCRKDVIRAVFGVNTSCGSILCIPKWSFHKIIFQFCLYVFLIDVDKVITVRPHWC